MMAISRKTILLAVCLAAVAAAAYWWAGRYGDDPSTGGAGAGKAKRLGQDIPVHTAVARTQDVPVTIDAIGTVQALNTVTIRTQVSGKLLQLPFKEGEDVKKGDIVALIEPDPYQAAYDQVVAKKAQDEANLANARIDVVRYQKLAANKYGSEQQYETQKWLVAQLEAQVRADQGAIDGARTTLNWATIRSPIDGRAGIRLVDVGNILDASNTVTNAILVITQLKPIYVNFTIPQEALPALQRAVQKGTPPVQALGPDNATLIESGVVSVIDNQIDQATGTAKIKATYGNPELRLWPGQFANVRVVVDTLKNAIVVPATAIRPGPSGPYVYILTEGDMAITRNVKVSQQDENIAAVASGLKAGDTVLTSGFGRLSDGAKVRVVSDEPDAFEGKGEKEARDDAGSSPGALTPPKGESKRNREGRSGGTGFDRVGRAPQEGEALSDGAREATAPAPAGASAPDESHRRSEPAQRAGARRQ